MSLIPIEQLLAARDRYERQQAAARAKQLADDRAVYERQQAELAERASVPVPTEKRPFVYVPRTAEQWEPACSRADATADGGEGPNTN
jgi:hypothetical protein